MSQTTNLNPQTQAINDMALEMYWREVTLRARVIAAEQALDKATAHVNEQPPAAPLEP